MPWSRRLTSSRPPGNSTGAPPIAQLRAAESLYVVGRGLGLGIAQEAALKFKETCGLHAEAFSAAEVRHGPMALVRSGFPVLAFAQHDETREDVEALAAELCRLGADVLVAGSAGPGSRSRCRRSRAHPAIEPLLLIQSFYRLANALAHRARPRSGSPAAPAQDHRDGLMPVALVNGRVLGDNGIPR